MPVTKPSNLGQWATGAGRTVEPLLAEKQDGLISGKKIPARWINWKLNTDYLWNAYVDAFETLVHTWTALQSFAAGLAAGAADGSHGMVDVLGVNNTPAVYGAAGGGATGVGVVGQGADRALTGNQGVIGLGGAGTGTNGVGGFGGVYFGGAGGPGAGVGGVAVSGTGGAVDGTTNTAGAGGVAGTFVGGAITSDANARLGGEALKVTGGLGQAGYGAAVHAVHGNVNLDDGAINQLTSAGAINTLQDTQVNGELEVIGHLIADLDLSVTGAILGTAAVIAPTLGNSWINSGGSDEVAGYWQDKFGNVHLQGTIKNGVANSVAFTLPVGYRPTRDRYFPVYFETSTTGAVFVLANGDVKCIFSGPVPIRFSLDSITFRP